MRFRIIGSVRDTETIAAGSGIRDLPRLRKIHGPGWWRKRKGVATIELPGGVVRTAEVHWYEATGVGKVEYKIKRFLDRSMTTRPDPAEARFAVCLRNDANPASLEVRKLYRVLPDPDASAAGMLRIVDESGEDYLYPAEDLLVLTLSREVEQALLKAS